MSRRFQSPYPPEFRDEAVRLVRMSRRPIPEVAAELGVNDQTLRNWVFAARADGDEPGGVDHRRQGGARPAPPSGQGARAGTGHPEKSRGLVRQGDRLDPVGVFEFVDANQASFEIAVMCRVLGVSTSGYCGWRQRPPSARAVADEVLTEQIRAVHDQSRQTYGYRRVTAELVDGQGGPVGRHRVARLVRAAGIQGVTPTVLPHHPARRHCPAGSGSVEP